MPPANCHHLGVRVDIKLYMQAWDGYSLPTFPPLSNRTPPAEVTERWHLAPSRATTCDAGEGANSSQCSDAVQFLASAVGQSPGRSMKSEPDSGPESMDSDEEWDSVPVGCSVETGGDWTAYFKSAREDYNHGYQLVCSGAAAPVVSFPTIETEISEG